MKTLSQLTNGCNLTYDIWSLDNLLQVQNLSCAKTVFSFCTLPGKKLFPLHIVVDFTRTKNVIYTKFAWDFILDGFYLFGFKINMSIGCDFEISKRFTFPLFMLTNAKTKNQRTCRSANISAALFGRIFFLFKFSCSKYLSEFVRIFYCQTCVSRKNVILTLRNLKSPIVSAVTESMTTQVLLNWKINIIFSREKLKSNNRAKRN